MPSAKPPDLKVRAVSTDHSGDDGTCLSFSINGGPKGVNIEIGGLTKALVEDLPPLSLDLLEIAALVYGVDAAVSRGGSVDRNLGEKWYRSFDIELPVRCQEVWSQREVQSSLQALLSFLSGDSFKFRFVSSPNTKMTPRFFKFAANDGWQPDRILMFSGGLDSFAGALEEMVDHQHRVALISHFSSTKVAPIQKRLKSSLDDHCGPDRCKHFPVRVHLSRGTNRETTYRTRSFLFAALGTIVAGSFGKDRVSFHENGVVSLNLPPVANVVSTRATRTTHPQTMGLMSDFFSTLLRKKHRIDNPFFWRTKTDVVKTISRLGMAKAIVETNSCADTRNRTIQHPHCGRCSQCIDRRFAVLAANLEEQDPEDAYAVALFGDPRQEVRDREIALSYVRNALNFEAMTPTDLRDHYSSILDAVNFLDHPSEQALALLNEMLRRHGAAVANVMRDKAPRLSDAVPDSLPCLFGEAQKEPRFGAVGLPPVAVEAPAAQLTIELPQKGQKVIVNGNIEISGKSTVRLMNALAESYLHSAGQGLDPLDYSFISASRLANQLGIQEDALRRSISRLRNTLRDKLASAGMHEESGLEFIENIPWNGYRLSPDRVQVRRKN